MCGIDFTKEMREKKKHIIMPLNQYNYNIVYTYLYIIVQYEFIFDNDMMSIIVPHLICFHEKKKYELLH